MCTASGTNNSGFASQVFFSTAACNISLSTSATNVVCNGGSTGAIDLSVSGGSGSYTYLWSDGSTTEDITSLVAGAYSVTVTDSWGCTATTSVTTVSYTHLTLPTICTV